MDAPNHPNKSCECSKSSGMVIALKFDDYGLETTYETVRNVPFGESSTWRFDLASRFPAWKFYILRHAILCSDFKVSAI
jgi:hypothetical protein